MMEVAAVKRDFRAFSQHLEQLLKSDDKPMGKNENDEEKEFSTPKEENSSSCDTNSPDHEVQEPRDLRTQKRRLRESVCSLEEKGNKNDKQDDLDFPQYSHKPDHDDVNGCSACGLLSSLDYLRRHRLLCDVIFQVQSQTFYAHRAVMASCSEAYREKYMEEIRQNRQKQLDVFQIEEVSPKIFQKLLDFIYTAKIEFDDREVYSLLDAANLLKIKGLSCKCFQYIKSRNNFSSNHIYQQLHKLGENNAKISSLEKQSLVTNDSKITTLQNKNECEKSHAQTLQRRASDSATNNTMDLSAKRPRYYSYSPAPLTGPNSVDESFPINDEVRSSSPKNVEFLNQSRLKKHEYIGHRNLPSATKNSKHFSPSSSSVELRENADDIQFLRNSPIKPSYPDRQNLIDNYGNYLKNGFYKPVPTDQQKWNGLRLSDWFSPSMLNEKIRNAQRQNPFSAQQEKHNENVWSNFFRNRMLAKDCNFFLRYGSNPFYSNPFALSGQMSPEKKAVNVTNSSSLTVPKMDLSSGKIFLNSHQNNRVFFRQVNDYDTNKRRELNRDVESFQTDDSNKSNDVDPAAKETSNSDSLIEKRCEIQAPPVQAKLHSKTDDALKPYNCPLCDAQFNRPANLKTHMRIHSGEKPYKCDTCGARFVQVAHLRAHVLIHTGEKPYPCNVCGTSFRHLQTLKSHLRIHTGEKPYSCEKCRVRFRHKSQLRLHLRTKHGVQTNTKKTYKQVPGLRSADISAHIKRAQEAAKSNSSERAILPSSLALEMAKEKNKIETDLSTTMMHPFSSKRDAGPFSTEQEHDELDQQKYKVSIQAHFAKIDSDEVMDVSDACANPVKSSSSIA